MAIFFMWFVLFGSVTQTDFYIFEKQLQFFN